MLESEDEQKQNRTVIATLMRPYQLPAGTAELCDSSNMMGVLYQCIKAQYIYIVAIVYMARYIYIARIAKLIL